MKTSLTPARANRIQIGRRAFVSSGQRWDRFQAMLRNKDVWSAATIRAFLMTPREESRPSSRRSISAPTTTTSST